jgi:hypothetical protein
MRRLSILAMATTLLMTIATGVASASPPEHAARPEKAPKAERVAPADKVDVCHRSGDGGTFHMINISSNALPAHIAHGDALAGGSAVPGMPTYEFDENCDIPSKQVVEGEFSKSGLAISFSGYLAFDDAVSGMGSYSYSVNGNTMDVEILDMCLDESAKTASVWGSGESSLSGDGFMVLTLIDTGGGTMSTRALFFADEAGAESAFDSQCTTAVAGASGGTGYLTFL